MEYKGFSEEFTLAGKSAIVTGASSGIGLETAKMFARKGADIAAFDVKASQELEAYAAEQGRRYISIVGDITKKADVIKAVKEAHDAFGKIDILFNCAGIGATCAAQELPEEMWDRVLDVNLKGTVLMSIEAGKLMIAQGGGKIINMASQAGVVALDGHLAYGASKAGIIYVTKQFALEWAKHNVNVNCISPTVIMTEMAKANWTPENIEAFEKLIPARRMGYPEEVAACAVFLASDASLLVNGANLVIDGGYTIG